MYVTHILFCVVGSEQNNKSIITRSLKSSPYDYYWSATPTLSLKFKDMSSNVVFNPGIKNVEIRVFNNLIVLKIEDARGTVLSCLNESHGINRLRPFKFTNLSNFDCKNYKFLQSRNSSSFQNLKIKEQIQYSLVIVLITKGELKVFSKILMILIKNGLFVCREWML